MTDDVVVVSAFKNGETTPAVFVGGSGRHVAHSAVIFGVQQTAPIPAMIVKAGTDADDIGRMVEEKIFSLFKIGVARLPDRVADLHPVPMLQDVDIAVSEMEIKIENGCRTDFFFLLTTSGTTHNNKRNTNGSIDIQFVITVRLPLYVIRDTLWNRLHAEMHWLVPLTP